MRRNFFCKIIVALIVISFATSANVYGGVTKFAAHISISDEPITPITARFIEKALRKSNLAGAQFLILELDTPGGLVTSTSQIVKTILNSDIPVVVYVSPSGGRAASAGLFITLASHVAAMSPGTRIGAAHPVSIGGLPLSPEKPPSNDQDADPNQFKSESVLEEKQLSDAVAWVRSLAKLRGRNAQWAQEAVTKSKSIIAKEALEKGVIEIIAFDINDLLGKLDNYIIEMDNKSVLLRTAGLEVRKYEMWWGERILLVISNPNLAFLLLIFGFYGVLFELYTPGWGVSGTLGALCLMLGFLGLAFLPINYVGLLLIIAALIFFVTEAFVVSFGMLTLAGVICLILGGIILIDTPVKFMRISLSLLIPISLATAAITVFLLMNIIKTHRKTVKTGTEAMLGKQAIAVDDFTPKADIYIGTVLVHGEYWKAQSETPVSNKDAVLVDRRDGLLLYVSLKTD